MENTDTLPPEPDKDKDNNGGNANEPSVKMIEKQKYDEALSRLAEMNKKLKAFEDKDKSDMQLKEEQLENNNKLLKELQGKLNTANVNAELAECRSKLELNESDDLKGLVSIISAGTDDDEVVVKNAKALSKLLLDAYDKGVKSVETKNYNDLSKTIFNTDGSKADGGEKENIGAILAKQNKGSDSVNIKNYYRNKERK